MNKKILIPILCLVILIAGYYFISHNSKAITIHSKISINEVELLTINDKKYRIDDGTNVVTKIISLYNEAKIFKKDGDTTASNIIVIQLKNGQKIDVAGTTQGFHYVNDGEKSYKISSVELSQYLRSGMK